MSLAAGQTLGQFEVLDLLGSGGMGEVYRARDLKLGREVALKIVRPALAEDPDGLARFTREARLLAALNHPHIATLYDLMEADGVCCLVMELVPGPTLAEQLRTGPMSIPQACELARQIADALEVAHAKGIVHRDLKPGNIKLSERGQAKVLDFGLAKALHTETPPDNKAHPTISFGNTSPGLILGTPAYMSPEQARGEPVDARADVWAFGCVLYEMLTGQRAFAGPSVADVLVAVLEREPDWSLLPAQTPPPIRDTLLRCLRKDPARRLRDIRDVRIEIEEGSVRLSRDSFPLASSLPSASSLPMATPLSGPPSEPTSAMETLRPSQTLPPQPTLASFTQAKTASNRSGKVWLAVAALILVVGGLIGYGIWQSSRRSPVEAALEADPFGFLQQFTNEGFKLQKNFLQQFGDLAKQGFEQAPPTDDVAVLPLETPFDWFDGKEMSEQLAAAITEALGADERLRVVAHNKVRNQGPFFKDAQRVGRDLGATHVLTGKLSMRAGELEAQVELLTTTTGTRRWGKTFIKSGSRPGAVQNLARDIAAEVAPKLVGMR